MNPLRRFRPARSKLLIVPTALALLALGAFSAFIASSSTAASGCTLVAATSGSDSSNGSPGAPFATVQKLLASLSAGQTGCLTSGQTFSGGLNLSHGGSASGQITVTSTDPSNPATIYGRVVTHPGADYIDFTNLRFNWDSGGQNLPSITLASDHVSFTYDDIQNGNTSICVNVIADSTWGTAHSTVLDHDRVHNCGQRPVTSYTSPGYFSHALYISGVGTRVTNNYIYDTSGKGVLLRGSSDGYVANNTIDNNGTGVAFGDLAATNNEVTHNIITNSNAGCACNAYGAFAWWGSTAVGSGNTFHDNCLSGNQDGNVDTSAGGFTASSNTIASPSYANVAAKDYALRAGSPCAGFGVDGTPGTGAGTSPPTTTSATTTAAAAPKTPAPSDPGPSPAMPVSTSSPAVSGDAALGASLTAAPGSWSGAAPLSVTYQWQRCVAAGTCSAIEGATSTTYVPTTADLSMSVRVAVAASNLAGSAVAVSDATSAVSGTYTVTQTVADGTTASGSLLWQATPSGPSDHVDFLVDGKLVESEKSAPYGAPCDSCVYDTAKLSNQSHVFEVKAYTASGVIAATSSTVTVSNIVAPSTLTPPIISGDLQVGSAVSASTGGWSGGGTLALGYTWLRCSRSAGSCSQISGANSSTYVLQSADRNARLRVMVSAQNDQGSAAATSDATGAVKR